MKRKVDHKVCYRELGMVRTSTKNMIEHHLGAAYRLHVA